MKLLLKFLYLCYVILSACAYDFDCLQNHKFWDKVEKECPDTHFRMITSNHARSNINNNIFYYHMINNITDQMITYDDDKQSYHINNRFGYFDDGLANIFFPTDSPYNLQNKYKNDYESDVKPVYSNNQYKDTFMTPDLTDNIHGSSNIDDDDDGTVKPQCITTKNRIVGGSSISITQAPYQVIYADICGGAILSSDWIITAAHCGDSGMFVRAGFTSRRKATTYRVCGHHIHPLWKSRRNTHTFDYDFQLLLLDNPIALTTGSIPIAIGSSHDLIPGRSITVTGWGLTKENGESMVQILRGVNVPILKDETCRNIPSDIYRITKRMFCAGYRQGGKDACQGDSGGPAVSNGKLVGLVSFGEGCGRPNRPGVYSKISSVHNWIEEVTGIIY